MIEVQVQRQRLRRRHQGALAAVVLASGLVLSAQSAHAQKNALLVVNG